MHFQYKLKAEILFILVRGDRMEKKPVYEKQFEHLKTVQDDSSCFLCWVGISVLIIFAFAAIVMAIFN